MPARLHSSPCDQCLDPRPVSHTPKYIEWGPRTTLSSEWLEVMMGFRTSPRCEDPLGIESWRADDENQLKEKPRAAYTLRTPDLGRGHSGEPIPAGPPGSAPVWDENGDGRNYVASPLLLCGEGGGLYASAGSKDVLKEAWKEIARGSSSAISKATFICVHVDVHRRMQDAEETSPSNSDAALFDLRSDAEMNWAANSKGRTVMDFQQFEQACSGMVQGLGLTEESQRFGDFCSVVLGTCRAVGEDQKVNRPATRPVSGGLVSSSALPPDSPLRGSFPAIFGEGSGPEASGRWLLRSARPKEGNQKAPDGQESYGEQDKVEEGRARCEQQKRQQQQRSQRQRRLPKTTTIEKTARGSSTTVGDGSSPPARRVDAAVIRKSATEPTVTGGAASFSGGSVMVLHRAESCQSWPPAWVKQNNAGNRGGNADGPGREEENESIIIAKGMHATAPSPSPGPQVKAVDYRSLIGSVSKKALMLQEELRGDRARLLELQRCAVRGSTGRALLYGNSPRSYRTDQSDGEGGEPPAAMMPDDPERASTTLPSPESASPSAVLGYRFSASGNDGSGSRILDSERAAVAAGAAADMTDSWEGSAAGSLSTGSLASGARNKTTTLTETVVPREKAIILPCRLCRKRESALWCPECKLAFCAICFAKVPHHQTTGLLLHDPTSKPHRRHQSEQSRSLSGGVAAAAGGGESSCRRGDEDDAGATSALLLNIEERQPFSHLGRLQRGRPRSLELPVATTTPTAVSAMEMEGRRMGATKGRRKSRRASAMEEEKRQHQVAVLPQDELAAFRSIPALCLNSASSGVCSARDFHNNKYALAAAKAVSPRGLPLDFSKGKGRYNYGGGSLNDGDDVGFGGDYAGRPAGDVGIGEGRAGVAVAVKGVKTFGGTSVRVVVQ